MKDWYFQQTPRDRLIVIAVGCLVVAGLLYAFVWYPVNDRIARAESAIASKSETLEYLKRGAAQIRASGGVRQPLRETDREPYLLIDEIIRRSGLEQPERLEPSGASGARVQFSEVPFDRLVQVLAELETYGLQVSTLTVTRRETGVVSARLDMERG